MIVTVVLMLGALVLLAGFLGTRTATEPAPEIAALAVPSLRHIDARRGRARLRLVLDRETTDPAQLGDPADRLHLHLPACPPTQSQPRPTRCVAPNTYA